jgi:hypothetical protein
MRFSKLGLAAGLAAGTLLLAQNAEFVDTMKSVAGACGTIKKLDKKTGKDAVRNAEKVAAGYEFMINFWRQRNAADAVKVSEAGKSAAVRLAAAAHAGDEEKALASFNELAATCQGCHEKHREKLPDGKYKVK